MRVAVLAHSFPRFRGDTHGTFVESLCEATARLGHQMHVLVPFDRELRREASSSLHVESFRYVWPDAWHLLGYSRTLQADVGLRTMALLLSPLYFLFAERALTRLVRRERIDLVHAHWLLPNGFVADRVRRRTGVPFAVTMHGSDVFMAERNALFAWLGRRATFGSRHITSCSGDLVDRLVRVAGPAARARLLLVPNGTDLGAAAGRRDENLAKRWGIGANTTVVSAIGRMVYKKGFTFLVDAAPAILAADPNVRLVIGGSGDLLASLRAQASALGIDDRVCFTGNLPHDEVLGLLALSDVFVMPSIRDRKGNIDGLPIVVLEAMAQAVPVVATNLAGIPLAVIDGVTGCLVPEQSSSALAAAVLGLLHDEPRRRQMGAAGRQRIVAELNWDVIARRHDELYRRAVA